MYKVAGHGAKGAPPLLFLHGGPGYNSYSFEAQAGHALERHVQMIYLDQRGSGCSGCARPVYARRDGFPGALMRRCPVDTDARCA